MLLREYRQKFERNLVSPSDAYTRAGTLTRVPEGLNCMIWVGDVIF